MHNISKDQQFLAQTKAGLSTTWTKPQLTVAPLNEALGGGAGAADAATVSGVADLS